METSFSRSAAPAHPASVVWRWLAAAAVFGCILLNYWWNSNPANGQNMGQVSAQYPTLLTPAGWAFSIWGVIFLALAVYAVWQLLPAQRPNPLPDAVAAPLSVASVAAALWVVCFSYEVIGTCTVLMLLTLAMLILAYGRARRLVRAGSSPRPSSWPLSLFMGWISVATVINVTLGLRDLGWTAPANVSILLSVVLLAVVVALGLLLSYFFRDAVYPVVLAWALIGIWAVRRADVPELGWLALAGAALVGIVGVLLAWRRRRA
ncbi:tryptophan-rich sensory protein [Hymenobacter coalescens]